MGSLPMPKLPVIDMSSGKLKPGTSSWLFTSGRIRHALEEYGCFVASYDKVPLELHKASLLALEDLFNLSTETKMKNTSDEPYFGYVGHKQQLFVPPLYEGMGIYPATLEGTRTFAKLMWPNGNDNFSKIAHTYSKLVAELEQTVKRMVFESYGVEKYYESHVQSSNYLLRVMKYRVPEIKEDKIGCNMHTDKSFITILHSNQVSGLEIRSKDGDWIAFEPSPNAFLVMTGDALFAWSNGRIQSAVHRVVMDGSKPRYSLGLFSYNSGIIEIPKELVDDEHPLKFKPFDHFGLLRYYFTDQGSKADCTAYAYCGV